MMRPSLLCLALLSTCVGACERAAVQQGASDVRGPARDKPTVGNVVFNPMRVAKIEIDVGENDWAILHEQGAQGLNPEADSSYVVANLRYDGELFEMVGLRVKGNSSRRASADNPDAMPYKLDMNKYVAGQKLDGLTKINLHRNASLNEYLSYSAFRKAGVASSRTGWADIYLNGVSLGLYTLVEQVDKRMLEAFYEDPEGELYKPEAPAGYLSYRGDDIAAYGDIGYKADKATNHATFLKLVRTIEQEPVDAWDEVIDTVSVLEYMAGNVALGNWDSYVAMGHNYYLFEDSPGHLTMLPWDLNLSQGSSGVVCPSDLSMGGGPGGPAGQGPSRGESLNDVLPGGFIPPDGATPPDGFMPAGHGALLEGGRAGLGRGAAPLYTRLMASQDGFSRYAAALRHFLQGPGSAEQLNSEIDAVVPVLGERLATSTVESLRSSITTRIAAIETSLATTTGCAAE